MEAFVLVPQPQSCVLQAGNGLRVEWEQGLGAVEIAKRLRAGGDEFAFSIRQMSLQQACDLFGLVLPGNFLPDEGYVLVVQEQEVTVGADTEQGAYYAKATLSQMMASATGDQLPRATVIDWPDLGIRAFNLCYHVISERLPSLSPNFEAAIDLIENCANMKMNGVVFELEGMFPYQKYPEISNKIHFSMEQMHRLREVCEENHVEFIPLVQCLGHAYYVLRHPEFHQLREVPRTTQQYCPCKQEVREFYLGLLEEILNVFTKVRYVHLGGDESRRLGECPVCAEKLKTQGMGHLYGDHINAISRVLLDRGIQPIVWGDIFEEYLDTLDVLDKRIMIAYWNYDVIEWYRSFLMQNIMNAGFKVVGCPAAKFAFTSDYFYLYQKSMRNVSVMGNECKRVENEGMLVTDWPKFSTSDVSFPSLGYGAEVAWGSSTSQKDFSRRFSRLFFGVEIPEFDQVCKSLSELSWGNMSQKEDCWIAPYANMHQTESIDGLDRLDQSRSMGAIGRIIAENTRQEASPRVTKLLNKAIQRAEYAQQTLESYRQEVKLHSATFDAYLLAAETLKLKSRFGLALDEAVKLLKYPVPGEEAARRQAAEELAAVREEWDALAAKTRQVLSHNNFAEILDTAMDYHFPPEAALYLDKYADCLRRNVQLQGLLTFKEYEHAETAE